MVKSKKVKAAESNGSKGRDTPIQKDEETPESSKAAVAKENVSVNKGRKTVKSTDKPDRVKSKVTLVRQAENKNKSKAIFQEDDQVVAMEIGQDQVEFPSGDEMDRSAADEGGDCCSESEQSDNESTEATDRDKNPGSGVNTEPESDSRHDSQRSRDRKRRKSHHR